MKKAFLVLLSLTMLMGCFAGCSLRDDPSGGEGDYSDRPVKITFSYYKGGFGIEWLEAVTKDYMDNINTDVYIELKASSDNAIAKNNIVSDVGIADLYQIEYDMFNLANSLEDLSDVYEMNVYGEEVKVRDKVPQVALDYYEENGTYYQLSLNRMTGWNWVYNKTVLDNALGAGKYRLPRTTDEFLALGDQLYSKGVFLTAGALADVQGGEYLHYAFDGWFAQMLGLEKNERYFDGYTQNSAGEWVFCRDNPQMIADNQSSIEAVYTLAENLLRKTTSEPQYLHKDSVSMEYKDLDKVFYGGKFKRQQVPRFAFAYIGEWLEREVEVFFEDGSLTDRNQEIYVMKMPVISAIRSRTPSIKDDTVLAAVVDYVDGVTDTKPVGVKDADVEIVREARNIVVENLCNQLVIPKNAKNKETTKQFIAYLCSDRAQKIAAQATSGIAILPFGYKPTDEDMGFAISPFIRSVQQVTGEAELVNSSHLNQRLAVAANLTWYYDNKNPTRTIAKDIHSGSYTPVSGIYQSTYDYFNRNWENFLQNYDNMMNK